MEYINTIIVSPLGYLMNLCHTLTSNYGMAIILFTLLTKIILFPVNLMSQKNAIRMAKIKPKLDEVKQRYSGDKDRISDEHLKLYRSEKYNPFVGLLPLFLQIVIIIGLIKVLYNPLQYIQIDIINVNFLGVNLGEKASTSNFSPSSLAFVLLSAFSSFAMCFAQSKIHVIEREHSAEHNRGMITLFTSFSFCFPFMVPFGVTLYWITSNLLSIPVMFLLNIVYDPSKYIDYSNRPKPKQIDKALLKANRLREKADLKRFNDAGKKRLVFYSEQSGYYKYFKNVLEYVLENSDIKIHYVTSDPNDAIFKADNPKLIPYYIGERALISLTVWLDADMMVMTMPDLHKYHIKRSTVRKNIEYVYIPHTILSVHMTLREGALNHYDTIFCVGPHQVEEIRKTELVYKLPPKRLIECGYGLLDNMAKAYAEMPQNVNRCPQILVAPSWHEGNIMESCLSQLLQNILGKGYFIIVRPHPEFIKRFPTRMDVIIEQYKGVSQQELIIQTDFFSNDTVYQSDILITDWSNIAFEFSFVTKKTSLFINTPMKVMNPNYKRIEIEPLDITLRDMIGASLDLDKLTGISGIVEDILKKPDIYKEKISEISNRCIYNFGQSGKVGGEYIIQALCKGEKYDR